jgi:hypothetical protein
MEYIIGSVLGTNTDKFELVKPSLYYNTVARSLQNDFNLESTSLSLMGIQHQQLAFLQVGQKPRWQV